MCPFHRANFGSDTLFLEYTIKKEDMRSLLSESEFRTECVGLNWVIEGKKLANNRIQMSYPENPH